MLTATFPRPVELRDDDEPGCPEMVEPWPVTPMDSGQTRRAARQALADRVWSQPIVGKVA